jgi:hypothetical protein
VVLEESEVFPELDLGRLQVGDPLVVDVAGECGEVYVSIKTGEVEEWLKQNPIVRRR